MNIAGSLTAHFNNFKGNPSNLGKRDKTNNLKIDIIIDNTVKAKEDNDFNFLNNKNDLKRGNKRRGRSYNKENNNKNKKI